ncbi:MAG: hypothetical protein COA91_00840 [Robiginitomaculum sp.]|nr:MAG: hypothetical protein COA91_00840 [Robiginitomaculum sp.]
MMKRTLTRPLRNIYGFAGLFAMTFIPLTSHAQMYSQVQIYNQAQNYTVEINKTQILHLPAPASAIVVGNTAIADVTVHSPNLLFIIGRGYGVTNLIALNDVGQTIMEADIQVTNSSSGKGKRVMLVGQGWQSYACSPFCQPAPVLSDDPGFVAQFKGKGKAIDNAGTTVTAASYPAMTSNPSVLGSALPQYQPPARNTATFNPSMRPVIPQAVMSARQQPEQ